MSLTQDILSEETAGKLLSYLSDTLDKLFHGRSRQTSYQDSYHCLYRLFKGQRGVQIEETTLQQLQRIFREELSGLNPENSFLEELTRKLVQLLVSIQKMMKVYFFVESSYFESEGKGSLRHLAYATLKQALLEDKQVFKRFVDEMCSLAFSVKANSTKDYGLFREAIEVVAKLDSTPKSDSIFGEHLFSRYMSLLAGVNRTFVREWKGTLDELLVQAYELYKHEKAFLWEYFTPAASERNLEKILKSCYNSIVTVNLEGLLSSPECDQLFDGHLRILYVLAKLDERVLQRFSDFYLHRLNRKLEKLDSSKCIVRQFSCLYHRITSDLQDFDVSLIAKVKLTFETWLNKEARTVNKLNVYIGQLLDNINNNKENSQGGAMEDFMVIFKFIKDKDMFERGYRRLLVERIIAGTIDLPFEQKLVALMREECGAHWTKSIEGVLEEHPTVATIPHSKIFSEQNWPFNENFKWIIDKDLLELKQQNVKQYHQLHPNRLLRWHPVFGNGTAVLHLRTGVHHLQMTTGMMNFLLSFNHDEEVQLGRWVHSHHIDFELMRKHVYSLIRSGLLASSEKVNGPQQLHDSLKLHLNLDYSPESDRQIALCTQDASFDLVRREELSIDRKVMVDSIIIRYFKQNRQSTDQQLFESIAEAIEKKGFSPNSKFVEGCLNDLIARDFVRKIETGGYTYVP